MHTDQLKYLSVINTYGSLRSAAEKLFITPSALSSSVKKLEEELGFQLLERSNQGVTLTQFGQKLLILANKFELDIANIPQELNTYSHFLSQATSFKWISHSFQVFANPVLSQLLIKISHDYPQIKMFPVRMNHSQLTAGSWHEQTPLAFTSLISTTNGYIDHLSSDLTFHMLYSSDLYLVVSSSKYATLSHIHLKDIRSHLYLCRN